MHWLWVMIVGSIIGLVAASIVGEKRGCLFNVVAGIVGSSLGEALFDSWGPIVAGMAIIPSILGAVIFSAIMSFLLGRK
ncbi:MAG TPA: GlsB/YeaQ/YmgE family stress response membrane protein [Tetragenococcus sp.]|nr:GlsB/YeaQ/YmgE family stress response membrane protein [Tetragenococcus sp.]